MDLPGNSQPSPRAGRGPADPGGGREPDRLLHRTGEADGGQGSPSTASPATNKAPTTWWAARRWAVCSRRSLRLRAQEPPPHPDQRLDQIPSAHLGQRPLRMPRRRLLLGKPCTRGPWRWTTSCPGTRAARTTSATCRPSAFAAMPASDGRREAGCGFCGLEASGWVLLEKEPCHRPRLTRYTCAHRV